MLWLVGAGSKLAHLVAALLPRGCVSWSVGILSFVWAVWSSLGVGVGVQ